MEAFKVLWGCFPVVSVCRDTEHWTCPHLRQGSSLATTVCESRHSVVERSDVQVAEKVLLSCSS